MKDLENIGLTPVGREERAETVSNLTILYYSEWQDYQIVHVEETS